MQLKKNANNKSFFDVYVYFYLFVPLLFLISIGNTFIIEFDLFWSMKFFLVENKIETFLSI